MDDEEDEFDRAEDEDGHGGARFPRWHDRGADGTRQEVGAAEGHVGGGDSISSVEQGGAADSPFDGQPVGHSDIARMEMTAMSGPLPPSHEFAAYEKTLPGAADRILRMAEEAQKADIKADQDMRDAYREDRRAENWVFKFTSAMFSTVTIAAFACSIVFVALKLDSAAYLSFACTFASLIPRIVESFRGGGRSK